MILGVKKALYSFDSEVVKNNCAELSAGLTERKAVYFSWDEITRIIRNLLSSVFGRDVTIEIFYADPNYWNICFVEGLSRQEHDHLLNILEPNETELKECDMVSVLVKDLSLGISDKLAEQILPFTPATRFCDDKGISFIGADHKQFVLRRKDVVFSEELLYETHEFDITQYHVNGYLDSNPALYSRFGVTDEEDEENPVEHVNFYMDYYPLTGSLVLSCVLIYSDGLRKDSSKHIVVTDTNEKLDILAALNNYCIHSTGSDILSFWLEGIQET